MPSATPDETPTMEQSLAVIAADLRVERRAAVRDTHRALEAALRPLLNRDRLDSILRRAHEEVEIEAPQDAAARLRALVSARIFDALADALDAAREPSRVSSQRPPVWEHALPPTAQITLGATDPMLAEDTGKRRVRSPNGDSFEIDIEVETA